MTIIAFCDIHGHIDNLQRLIPTIEKADMAIFLGDGEGALETLPNQIYKKLIAVGGNSDLFSALPSEMLIEIAGKKFFITHGHGYGVKNGYDRIAIAARDYKADVTLWGHRHESHKEVRDGRLLVGVPPLGTTRTQEGNSYLEIKIVDGKVTTENRTV